MRLYNQSLHYSNNRVNDGPVPSLQTEPSSSAAIQESNSSFTTGRMVQDSLFYPGLFHLALSQEWSSIVCF